MKTKKSAARTPRKSARAGIPGNVSGAGYLSLPTGGLVELAQIAYPEHENLRRQFLKLGGDSSIDEFGRLQDQGAFLVGLARIIHALERKAAAAAADIELLVAQMNQFKAIVESSLPRSLRKRGTRSAVQRKETRYENIRGAEKRVNPLLARTFKELAGQIQLDPKTFDKKGRAPSFQTIRRALRKSKS